MIEREMEDLIADYPDDFFPNRGFELIARQKSFAGVGRFDLLFEDTFKTKVLMELKAVPARYEDATQLAKYKDEMRNRGETAVLMWLVAPQVSSSVREFLDRIGIEYSEIHITEFRRVAERHGISISSEEPASNASPSIRRPLGSNISKKQGVNGVLSRSREAIREAIYLLWQKQHRLVTRDQLAIELSKQGWTTEELHSCGLVDPKEQQKRIKNWVDWFSAEYQQELYGLSDEFVRERVSGKWAYRPSKTSA